MLRAVELSVKSAPVGFVSKKRKTMKIPCDPQIVAEMRSMIDPCDWKAIRECFYNWFETGICIDWVVLLSKDVVLEEMAAFIADKTSDTKLFQKMCEEKMIQVGNTRPDSGIKPYTFKLTTFEDADMFNVVCLPPFYVVKRIET